jgi:LysM repeat protein
MEKFLLHLLYFNFASQRTKKNTTMKKHHLISILVLILFSVKSFATGDVPGDTIVTKIVDGKKYVIHGVQQSEGWLAIARSYGITYNILRNSNKDVADKLNPGMTVKVPFASTRYSDPKNLRSFSQKSQPVYYKVGQGETMVSLAEQYGTDVDSLMKWNKAKNANLKKGAKIIIGYNTTYINIGRVNDDSDVTADNTKVKKAEPKSADEKVEAKRDEMLAKDAKAKEKKDADAKKEAAKAEAKKKDEDKKAADALSAKIKAEAKLADAKNTNKTQDKTADASKAKTDNAVAVKTPDKKDIVVDESSTKTTMMGKRKAVSEKGVAVWIEDQDFNSSKFFALHRTAPIGTIVKVTNSMNGKYVYVKVVGTLPSTGDNDGIIIKISKASADKAGVIDQRFQCELDYGVNL